MGVAKRKNKKGYTYEVNFTYKEDGVTKRFYKGGFRTKKEATNFMIDKQNEILNNGGLKKVSEMTFKDVYEEFLELGTSKYQANTIKNTTNYFHYFERFHNMKIREIDFKMLQRYFNSRKNEGIETNKCIKKSMNRIFNYAIDVGYIRENPLARVTVSGIERHLEHEEVLEYDDFVKLTDALDNDDRFHFRAYSIAIKIAYYTGLRVSEVLALNKSDLDLENERISVNKKLVYKNMRKKDFYVTHDMKSKSSKASLPFTSALNEPLREWFKSNPYEKVICDANGDYINPDTLSQDIKKVIEDNGINIGGFHFHMLRHTFATNLVMNNVDLKTIQVLMRHSNINTTMTIYAHIKEEHEKVVLNNVFSSKCGENVGQATFENLAN